MQNNIGPHNLARKFIRTVGHSGLVAIKRGQALCYKLDIGTAGDADGRRGNYVELPSSNNAGAFAGVALEDFTPGDGNAPNITIAEPGSVVEVLSAYGTTVNSGLLTFMAQTGGAGYFMSGAYRGRGSAIPLQTVAQASQNKEDNLVGGGSIDGTTLTDSAATFVTNGVQVGDRVVITGTGLSTGTPGFYTVASVTSETVLELNASASTAAQDCAYFIPSGQLTLVKLLDGEESWGAELLTPQTGAEVALTRGYTIFTGRPTAPAADVTLALHETGSGLPAGTKKKFLLNGTIATNDIMLNFSTAAIYITAASEVQACASVEIDAANEGAEIEWTGAVWEVLNYTGTASLT